MDDFWTWAIDKLSPGLRANTWYNTLQPYGLAGYLNDFSSRMVGFATLRQLRVKNSKFNSYSFLNSLIKKINFSLAIPFVHFKSTLKGIFYWTKSYSHFDLTSFKYFETT